MINNYKMYTYKAIVSIHIKIILQFKDFLNKMSQSNKFVDFPKVSMSQTKAHKIFLSKDRQNIAREYPPPKNCIFLKIIKLIKFL